jgi:hypothetical protein
LPLFLNEQTKITTHVFRYSFKDPLKDSLKAKQLNYFFTLNIIMMMMMMIFICVQRGTSETGNPETSRRVWGRAKLWNYSTEVQPQKAFRV